MKKLCSTKKTVAAPVVETTDNLDDLMGALTATPAKTKKKPTKGAKNLYDFTENPQLAEAISQFCVQKEIFDSVEKPFKTTKETGRALVREQFCEQWYENRSLPQNPKIEVKGDDGKTDYECMYIFTKGFSPQVNAKPKEDGTIPTPAELQRECVNSLIAAGMSEKNAENFVQNELDFSPTQGIQSFNRLAKGYKDGDVFVESSKAEKEVASKLLKFILGQEVDPITPEERQLAIYADASIEVRAGCLDRLLSYADSADDLKAMIAFLNPTHYLSRGKFAVNSTPNEKNNRLVEELSKLMGLELEEDE